MQSALLKAKHTGGTLSQSPSLASVSTALSTRVNSSNSLLDARSDETTALAKLIDNAQKSSGARKTYSARPRTYIFLIVVGLAYVWWSRYVGRASRRARTWGPLWLARCAAAGLTTFFWCVGVRGVTDVRSSPSVAPDQQAMFCLHPHGIAGIGPLALLGREPRRKNGKMENVFILAADIAFKVPGLRELFLFINGRAANESVIEDVFCSGGSVAVFPGGIHEQLRTDPGQEKLVFPPNLGFVRQAAKHGVPLVPIYSFGENQQFGRWGLPFMPNFHPIQSRFGRAVHVGAADPEPSDVRVHEIFFRYCAELQRLFDEFKDSALPPKVAARGLKITWRGHDQGDFSAGDIEDHLTVTPAVGQPAHGGEVEREGRATLRVPQPSSVTASKSIRFSSRL